MVPGAGLEPAWSYLQGIFLPLRLSLLLIAACSCARLPVPLVRVLFLGLGVLSPKAPLLENNFAHLRPGIEHQRMDILITYNPSGMMRIRRNIDKISGTNLLSVTVDGPFHDTRDDKKYFCGSLRKRRGKEISRVTAD